MQTVEAKIGDRFHILDRNRDGVVSAEELAFVIQHVLSSQSTEEVALALVQDLDVDRDGQISVQELVSIRSTTLSASPLNNALLSVVLKHTNRCLCTHVRLLVSAENHRFEKLVPFHSP